MFRSRAIKHFLCLLLVIAAWPGLARADPKPRVAVVIAGEPELSASVMEVVTERLATLDVEQDDTKRETIDLDEALQPDPTAAHAAARVWIDLTDAKNARLFITDATWDRVLAREFDRATRSDEVLREEIGLVVVSAVETLLTGAQVGAPRDEVRASFGLKAIPGPPPPEPAPPPKPAPPPEPEPVAKPVAPAPEPVPAPSPGWRVGGALVYEMQGYAEQQVLVHGPGVSLSADAPGTFLAPGGMLDLQYRIPYEQSGPEAGFRLQSLAGRLQAHLHALRHPVVALRVHGGMAAEILFLDPFLVEAGEAVLAPSRVRVAPIARFGLLAQVRLFSDTSLRLGFSGDVDIIGTRYVIQRGAELVPLVDPLRIRPSLTVGIATTFAGANLFPPARDPFDP